MTSPSPTRRAVLPGLVSAAFLLTACGKGSEGESRTDGAGDLPWYRDPNVVVTAEELAALAPIREIRLTGDLPTLVTSAFEGEPSFTIGAGQYIARLFTGGPDAPYELGLNLGSSHVFTMHDDWEEYPGVNATFIMSVSIRERGGTVIWKMPPRGEPIGGASRDMGSERETARHAMYKAVKRLHEWVGQALSGEV